MSLIDTPFSKGPSASVRTRSMILRVTGTAVSVCALAVANAFSSPASAAELTRSVDVTATPAQVWSVIGPFCAIKDWHPVVGTCTEDGKTPPTRTLVTKDGKVTFVEPETARTDHSYSYTFAASPFPVTHYTGTISVVAKGSDGATIVWHGTYTPNPGKAKEATADFAGVYETGLAALKTRFK